MSTSAKINILVTGAKGQLGNEIQSLADQYKSFSFTYIDIDEVDLSSEQAIRNYFKDKQFQVVINCAAYTAVDLAEDNKDLSFKVNSESARILAEIAKEKKIRMIHISTDYVFDGESNQPIDENAKPSPLSVYGHSKLEGEKHVLSILPDAYVIRTAWVYSTFGKNFVKTISALAKQRSELSVVADQIGSPTYANDLAGAILVIIDSIFNKKTDHPGIYHYSNEGVISWYDFAYFIIQYYKLPCQLKAIRTEEYKTKAARPKFSLLDKKKIKTTFGITPPHWHESLMKCLERLPQ
jgi:dTDP-4-dehydrorhamnose reductase